MQPINRRTAVRCFIKRLTARLQEKKYFFQSSKTCHDGENYGDDMCFAVHFFAGVCRRYGQSTAGHFQGI